jgi:hypothetical protein
MRIETIAKKAYETSAVTHFARRGTGECMWFTKGFSPAEALTSIRRFSDAFSNGLPVTLWPEDVAANDWYIIKPRS